MEILAEVQISQSCSHYNSENGFTPGKSKNKLWKFWYIDQFWLKYHKDYK